MTIFWRLLLAHLLTDFTFQTDKIVTWKRKSIFGTILHCGIFLILSLFLCIFSENFTAISTSYLLSVWWKFPGIISIVFLFILHFCEDSYRIWSIKKGDAQDNIFFFLWDQAIHIIFIFLFSPFDRTEFILEKPIIILVLAILATHFLSILIYYLEEIISGTYVAVDTFKKKYIFILERLIIFSCFLLPGFWWLIIVPVSIIKFNLNKLLKYKSTKLNTAVSILVSLTLGLIARTVIY